VLDSAVRVPGTNARVGLDPLLGLLPGIGDFLAAVLSSYVVVVAARLGAPRSVLARMLVNLGVDTLVGVVPLLGDLFDVGWKANMRNAALLEGYVIRPQATRRSSRAVVAAVAVALILMFVGALVVAGVLVRWLLEAMR
jgi:predicted phage tail protein